MWFLRFANGSVSFLHRKDKYTIGRKNTDILLNNDDSISRTHAILHVQDNLIFITDNGSKYGTYINEQRLEKNVKTQIFALQTIKLGMLDSHFQLVEIKLNILTSNVKSRDKAMLRNNLDYLRATRLYTWNTSCSFLVVSELILTPKVLCALTLRRPIVIAKYFDDLACSVRNNTPPPEPDKYLPSLNETLLNKNIKLEHKEERCNLFKGKSFIFLTQSCYENMDDLILLTGGKALLWEKENISQEALARDVPEYILIEEPLTNVDVNSDSYKSFTAAVSYLSEHKKRSIPMQEIAMAVVYCSCAEYCNRDFDRIALLMPASTQQQTESINILAYDTEVPTQNEAQSVDVSIRVTVPPSYETDMSTMMSTNAASSKRPMESDSVCSIPKKLKQGSSSPGSSEEFVFTKSTQANVPKTNIFALPRPKTSSTDVSTNITAAKPPNKWIENPFAKKRKAAEDIGGMSKKTPLENISNTAVKKSKSFLSSTLKQSTVANADLCEVSIIEKVTESLGSSVANSDNEEDDELVSAEKEAIKKRNAKFKNTILVEYIDIPLRRPNVPNISVDKCNNKSLLDFKKFRKALVDVQSQIITDSELDVYIVGESMASNSYYNDEDFDEEDAKFTVQVKQEPIDRPTSKYIKKHIH
ncbi:nbs [Carabus blaptoides fortunei]